MMDMVEFIEFAKVDPSVSVFLKEISDDLEEEHGVPPGTERFIGIPAAWLPLLAPILYLLVKEVVQWVGVGLEWSATMRLELKKRAKDRAQKLGLEGESADKALDALLSSGKLEQIVKSSLEQIGSEAFSEDA